MSKIITLIIFALLSGCATTQVPKVVIGSDRPVILPDYVYEPCKPLISLSSDASFEVLLNGYINNIAIYTECKNKQNASINVIKELTNIKRTDQ